MELVPTRTDLRDQISRNTEALTAGNKICQVPVTWEVADVVPEIVVLDDTRYKQILTNLILNSLVHGFDGKDEGNIKLSAKHDKKNMILEYTDDGRGIDPGLKDRIFEPFFTTDKKVGTGLGMHIVYNLVTQKLNGSISCSGEMGKGIQFLIKLP